LPAGRPFACTEQEEKAIGEQNNEPIADRQSCQGKDGYGRRFTKPRSTTAIQATTATDAELFAGQEGSCWEKHQMEVEIG